MLQLEIVCKEVLMTKEHTRIYLSPEVKFYTAEELSELLGWGLQTVNKLFNSPDFPSVNYGKCKVVEAHALIEFFSTKREKAADPFWRNG